MLYEYQIQNNVEPVSKLEACIRLEGMDPLYTYSIVENEERQRITNKAGRIAGLLFAKWI